MREPSRIFAEFLTSLCEANSNVMKNNSLVFLTLELVWAPLASCFAECDHYRLGGGGGEFSPPALCRCPKFPSGEPECCQHFLQRRLRERLLRQSGNGTASPILLSQQGQFLLQSGQGGILNTADLSCFPAPCRKGQEAEALWLLPDLLCHHPETDLVTPLS